LFQTALAAGDFVIAVPTQADFGQACDPTLAEFDPGQPRGEFCQVNPAAFAVSPDNSSFTGGRITRRPDSSRDLQIISSGALNTGSVETDGVDFDWAYQWDTDVGAFVFDGRLTYIREFQVSDFPGGQPDFDAAGFTNNDPTRRLTRSMPDLRGSMGLSYLRDRHFARLGMRYVGSYTDNGTANAIIDRNLDAYYAFDLNYAYNFPVGDGEFQITIGAIDLFDEDLPQLKNGAGTDIQTFDVRGRRLYASAKYAF